MLKWVGGLVCGLGLAFAAHAVPSVTYNGGTSATPCVPGTTNDNSQGGLEALIAGCSSATEVEVYKQNVGDASDSGSAAAWYSTTFANTPTDTSDATISWIGSGSFLNCVTVSCFLGIKDGKQTPAAYAYNITGWNGTSPILMTGFWADNGAISNVSIWTGAATTSTTSTTSTSNGNAPEPATGGLALLGVALLGVSLWRRRRA